jgi:AMMECR1 domain-containing protein
MFSIVRITLETYLREKRIITLSDITTDITPYISTKEAVFVTLYYEGRIIASSGRIACAKENTFYECIDNTLKCLQDPRFTSEIQDIDKLRDIHVRVDRFSPTDRRILQDVSLLDTKTEGIMILSQNLGKLAIILPNMVHIDSSAQAYFRLVCQKA